MKQSIGTTYLLNFVLTFIIILFAFLTATLSYYKAYKVNTRILQSIEKYEGYNGNAQTEINRVLGSLGYNSGNSSKCKSTKGSGVLIKGGQGVPTVNEKVIRYTTNLQEEKYDYCIYLYKDTDDDINYLYSYGVVTYIHINFPIINQTAKIPIFTKTEEIYKFTTTDS